MGLYHQYISRNLTPQQVEAERKEQLKRISQVLDCDVLTYAARISPLPIPVPTAVLPEDLVLFVDLLEGLKSSRIAVILETFGGVGEIGRNMVEILHERFQHVMFIVPGFAQSTGTIMVLGAHEILMGPGSALGPIDAQLQQDGKTFSADALIEGLERIKKEVEESGGKLNPAYIPILQKISPGEIEQAHNALEFARETVREWLVRYKFGKWTVREGTGKTVTEEYKIARADDIAKKLASQAIWKTHGRNLRIPDLRDLGLKIRDFSQEAELNDAIQRYHILLRRSLEAGTVYKLFETPEAVVARSFQVAPAPGQLIPIGPNQPQGMPPGMNSVQIAIKCPACGTDTLVQLDFTPGVPRQPGAMPFPVSGHMSCPRCGNDLDLAPARADIEAQLGRPAIIPQPTS